jgi:CheY-like chemotaxis protein
MRALIADPDSKRGRRIGAACACRGLSVENVSHGAEALERALATPPRLLVCPVSLPMIDGPRLSEILRTNPRTRDVTFLFLVEDELDMPVGLDPRDRFSVAPWADDDLLREIDRALQGGLRVRESGQEQAIEGNLAQVPLVDLLQLFHGNKKSGTVRLSLERADEVGTIVLRGGEAVDAALPGRDGVAIRGVKALFRLMTLREGRFEFVPEDLGGPPQIQTSTRALLLEAMRQLDEGERFRQTLPSPGLRVRPGPGAQALPEGVPPLTGEVLRVAYKGATVQEIVDRVPYPDYQILRTLHTLLSRGVLEPDPSPAPDAESGDAHAGVLTLTRATRMRDWAANRRAPIVSHLRVPVVASDHAALEALLEVLLDAPGFRSTSADTGPDPAGVEPDHLGPLVEVPLGEGLTVLFVAVPAEERFRAIWPVVAHDMLGAVVVVKPPLPEALARVREARAALAGFGGPLVHVLLDGDSPGKTAGGLDVEGPIVTLGRSRERASSDVARELFAALCP